MNYLDKVKEQLMQMSLEEKNAWILLQAKLISSNKQSDFLMSLLGTKKIIDMPSIEDIDNFCRQIEKGEIFFEYETHYCKFDEDGRYIDDWVIWYNDPFAIIPMMDKIFSGCRQLMRLEDYQTVYELLSRVLKLQIYVQEDENSEDSPEDEYLSLSDTYIAGKFSENLNDAGLNWIKSFAYLTNGKSNKIRAKELIKMFETPVCQMLNPRILMESGESQELFSLMEIILKNDIAALEVEKKQIEENHYLELIKLDITLTRKNELLKYIRMSCLDINYTAKKDGIS